MYTSSASFCRASLFYSAMIRQRGERMVSRTTNCAAGLTAADVGVQVTHNDLDSLKEEDYLNFIKNRTQYELENDWLRQVLSR